MERLRRIQDGLLEHRLRWPSGGTLVPTERQLGLAGPTVARMRDDDEIEAMQEFLRVEALP